MYPFPVDECLKKLKLHRLTADGNAGVAICSLPIPEGGPDHLSFAGRPTSVRKLGCWQDGITPRRLLMTADMDNNAPGVLSVAKESRGVAQKKPEISMELFDTCPDPAFMWERHLAKITWNGKSIGLVMGMRTQGEVHWWEACMLQIVEQDDFCTTVEVGGAIPCVIYDTTDRTNYKSYYDDPFLHKHRWLYGRIFARLYANGVCEIYAHHINNKFFDDGLDLPDCVPVIGFKTYDVPLPSELLGSWNGDRERLQIGHATLDVSEARRLATDRQPGAFLADEKNNFLVWQPYTGAELYGGRAIYPSSGSKDGFIYHAEDKLFPRGFGRTVRFSLSLSDRSPVVARYLAPAWWYGLCSEFMADNPLPVSNEYDEIEDIAMKFVRDYTVNGGFEDGSIARYSTPIDDGTGRRDPSWEGEFPYAQLLHAWRTGNPQDYDRALRAAYCFDDIYVDHASNTVRMHGWAPPATSVPMFRMQGSIAAFLETGDCTLYEDAIGIVDNAYRMHKNSWPRLCTGRDACFIRSAVMLYRYFNDEHYRRMARDAISNVILTQRPDGAFGDQGGGTGIHQWAAYIVKPWMGCMAVGGMVDYLELFPEMNEDTLPIWEAVKKFGDWLVRERYYHAGRKPGTVGVFNDDESTETIPVGMAWSYQHYFRDGTQFKDSFNKEWFDLKDPYQDFWQQEYLARILTFCSVRTGDPVYFDAWAETAGIYYAARKTMNSDHSAIQALQYIQWVQATITNARYTEEGLVCHPLPVGKRAPEFATVMSPDGNVRMKL